MTWALVIDQVKKKFMFVIVNCSLTCQDHTQNLSNKVSSSIKIMLGVNKLCVTFLYNLTCGIVTFGLQTIHYRLNYFLVSKKAMNNN